MRAQVWKAASPDAAPQKVAVAAGGSARGLSVAVDSLQTDGQSLLLTAAENRWRLAAGTSGGPVEVRWTTVKVLSTGEKQTWLAVITRTSGKGIGFVNALIHTMDTRTPAAALGEAQHIWKLLKLSGATLPSAPAAQ